ncbi:type IV conjugative transfer system lipoprotein TraV [Burkholderia gladioli]|uniref:type IV conjugative transfer system lipoprotein TraV n=1 Tax=Burkholderia gladioli TaxID=28095 RepID=UPI00163FA325|nr:type IV conjugative transfer system lipoprotein TraV [Burkholderia gladioli]
MMSRTFFVASAALFSLTACSFSGYDASSSFACKAPEGVLCNSMSGIYANAMAHNLPEQRVHTGSGATTNVTLGSYAKDVDAGYSTSGASRGTLAAVGAAPMGILPRALDSGAPVRTASREMRIWFAPWQDADADLHDQEYVYLIVDSGHWSIAHNQERIRAAFRPVMPPIAVAAPAGSDGKASNTGANADSVPSAASNADRVMQGILTPGGAVDRAATMPGIADR